MAPLVWLITGSSTGFGAEFVKALLKSGDKVIATARNPASVEHFKKAGASVLKLDLTAGQSDFDRLAETAIGIHGGVDVVVNNAGYPHFSTIEDDSLENWQKVFQTHVFGPVGVARAFLPHFRSKRAGNFVFMGSIAAWGGLPAVGAYCSSKAALRAAVESLNLETKPLGIRTLLVEPGYFRTEFLNEKNAVYIDTKIDEYKPLVDNLYPQVTGMHQQQPGDPAKGVSRILDLVRSQTAAEEMPVSLALGDDALDPIRKKCNDTLELLDKWAEKSSNTSF
ncbi:putative oxidoreductase YusZ [Colletotrichum orbiculare MAFF 240422]|uniref:Oxidoreductase YusZ n=1 Tax=Colletotrichum orbiculare (strain 104-T / ATCC 96160 / CBS 514.97 / LARS 414 / MAFF 240422) TaxID=1213857 RepID=N4V903_COLOR|nr:putative oxidoreductase YusZ [Colletotrichum orbiculare MAFF 240422]